MGEHNTWFDFLAFLPGWNQLQATAEYYLGRGPGTARPWSVAMFSDTHFTLTHVLEALLVAMFLIFGAFAYKGAATRKADGIVPPPEFNLRNLFEMFCDGVLGTMEGIMGKKNAVKYLPFIGSFAFFIFFANALALIPGFSPPTDTLKTNLMLGIIVFLATHYFGVREHGIKYFKHFLGPLPLLAPLFLIIEVISHIARPISLSMRLMGNMASDHKVVAIITGLVPFLVPVPFLVLGALVVIVQTLVVTLLSIVYISMAVADEEHH